MICDGMNEDKHGHGKIFMSEHEVWLVGEPEVTAIEVENASLFSQFQGNDSRSRFVDGDGDAGWRERLQKAAASGVQTIFVGR
jgi:hypothetical protein